MVPWYTYVHVYIPWYQWYHGTRVLEYHWYCHTYMWYQMVHMYTCTYTVYQMVPWYHGR
jgi:hypothetical protein